MQCQAQAFIKGEAADFHARRRAEILRRYPQVRDLFGHEPLTKYIILILFCAQIIGVYFAIQAPLWLYVISAYLIGASINHLLYFAIHDCAHNLACKKSWQNMLLAIFANLPSGIPVAIAFKRYHLDHHRFLGQWKKDVDLPLRSEAAWFNILWRKLIWLFLQPFLYGLRPYFVARKKLSGWEIVNFSAQLIFDGVIVWVFGWQGLGYLLLSTFFSMSIHPLAIHLIAEHYVVHDKQETYSYYGPFNKISLNIGHHVEHHDFPTIPWTRLPKLKNIAPEFYNSLYSHPSWLKYWWCFIRDNNITLFSRVVR